jgi:NAD(P)-dependent dehydrogenase (short-subunit alcohol dehydrogenase family)
MPVSETTPEVQTERIVIVGGSSGIGLALAELMLAEGAEVTIAGRSPERLAAAERELTRQEGSTADRLRAVTADITREEDIERLFKTIGPVDHVVTTAADVTGAYQPIVSFNVRIGQDLIDAKLVGAMLLAKHAVIAPTGSLTFTSGIAAYRPAPGGSMVAAVNGALASLASALAIEMAPVRVNVASPGWVDTPIWDNIAGDEKTARLEAMAKRLPAGRVGDPDDIAQAILALIRNHFITGTVLHVDGGQRLV